MPEAPAKVANFNPAPESTELRASPFLVELAELATGWPEAVREEIAQIPIPHVCVELPAASVCEGLKCGQVRFNWGELRAWVVGAPPVATPSVNSSTDLDLPLNILTPLFLDYIRATQLNRKVASAEHITEFFRRASEQRAHQAAPAGRPATPVATVSGAATDDGGEMSVSLSLVTAGWPEAILHEIQQSDLSDARIELPLAAVEAKLKTGKADFSWRQLATWIPGCPPDVLGSPHGAMMVNLPLSVVAPMFLKTKNGAASPRPPMSDLGIPDVFATPGKPAPEAAPAPPPPVVVAPPPAAVAEPALPATRQRATNLAELFGEPGKKTWTPKELVQGVARLPGVAGSLIALQDGLLVAQAMPASWKSDAMAAILPQIFGRINQYGKELNTGDAKAVAITTGIGTIQVYQAGIVYFAALSETDVPLPLEELQLVAGELGRRSQ